MPVFSCGLVVEFADERRSASRRCPGQDPRYRQIPSPQSRTTVTIMIIR